MPTTWKGYGLWIAYLIVATNIHRFTEGTGPLLIGLGAIIWGGSAFMKMKTNPNPEEIFDEKKDSINLNWKQGTAVVLGLFLFFVCIIWIASKQIDHKHATIGYPVRTSNEAKWFEFHAIKDDFVMSVTSYPKYDYEVVPISHTDITSSITTYSFPYQRGIFELSIVDMPIIGEPYDIDLLFSDAISYAKEEWMENTGEVPQVSTSSEVFLGFPTMRVTYEDNVTDLKVKTLSFVTNDRVWTLSYEDAKNNFDESAYKNLTESFRLEDVKPK